MYPSAELIFSSVELSGRGKYGGSEWWIESRVEVSRRGVPRLDCVALVAVGCISTGTYRWRLSTRLLSSKRLMRGACSSGPRMVGLMLVAGGCSRRVG